MPNSFSAETESAKRDTAAAGALRLVAYWPIGLAAGIRLVVWLMMPADRFASDEDSYYNVGTTLLMSGRRNLFWPPMTGWLIAAAEWLFQTTSVRAIRLVWVLLDIGCCVVLRTLAGRVAAALYPADKRRAARLVNVVTLGYALYLPAVSYAQFATSETVAMLFALLALVLITGRRAGAAAHIAAGLMTGALTLTRPSLAPLLLLWPLTIAWWRRSLAAATMFVVAGAIPVALVIAANWRAVGEMTIARNDAYNLYIGNRDMYAEDLNLFNPAATREQIEFRRDYFAGQLEYPALSPRQMRSAAWTWIRTHPWAFARRSLGRLARVFAPKTDVLELAGGESRVGIFSPRALALLAAANVEWAFILASGIVGLLSLRLDSRELSVLFAVTICGSLPLCLIAIAKPRYSFVFDPLLILGAAVFAARPAQAFASLRPPYNWVAAAIGAFLVWGWLAWAAFALSSRLAMRTL